MKNQMKYIKSVCALQIIIFSTNDSLVFNNEKIGGNSIRCYCTVQFNPIHRICCWEYCTFIKSEFLMEKNVNLGVWNIIQLALVRLEHWTRIKINFNPFTFDKSSWRISFNNGKLKILHLKLKNFIEVIGLSHEHDFWPIHAKNNFSTLESFLWENCMWSKPIWWQLKELWRSKWWP